MLCSNTQRYFIKSCLQTAEELKKKGQKPFSLTWLYQFVVTATRIEKWQYTEAKCLFIWFFNCEKIGMGKSIFTFVNL